MKKHIIALAILTLILCLLFASCRDDDIDEQIQRQAENFLSDAENAPLDDHMFGDYTQEIDYTPVTKGTLDGIISRNYTFNGNKYYFTLTKYNKITDESGTTIGSVDMIVYVDLDTGTLHYMCPDPLCTHTKRKDCKYLGFVGTYFVDKDVFYAERIEAEQGIVIYRVDLSRDEVRKVYAMNNPVVVGTYGGKLYFFDVRNQTTADRQTKQSFNLKIVDADGNIEDHGYMPEH